MGNNCSGGFKSVRKRRGVVASSSDERERNALTKSCCQILPIEVWECILGNLKDNTQDMLKCRLVCQDWKFLADGLLQEQPIWTPLFPYISSLPLIFIGGYGEKVIRRCCGTRFASARRLDTFLSQMEGYQDNPFPNRTVLLFPNPDLCIPSRRPHRNLYKKFPVLLSRFGHHITALEWMVRDGAPESVLLLRNLYGLWNLSSLTLYARDWNKRSVRNGILRVGDEAISLYRQRGDDVLSSLTQLQIMGSNGILPLNYLFGGVGKQITSLYFCFVDDASNISTSGGRGDGRVSEIHPCLRRELIYSLPHLFPNLIMLKVCEVNEEVVDRMFPHPGPDGTKPLSTLKHLSVKLQRPFVLPLNRLVQAVDEHCRDLESLHLEISRWPAEDPPGDEADNPPLRDQVLKIDGKIKLPCLKDLTISYSLFLQEPDFLFKFTEKCTGLKSISFVSVNIHSGNFPDFEGFCNPLWGRLPQTLRKISVRYWISSDFCGAYLPKKGSRVMIRKKKPITSEPIQKLQTCHRPKI